MNTETPADKARKDAALLGVRELRSESFTSKKGFKGYASAAQKAASGEGPSTGHGRNAKWQDERDAAFSRRVQSEKEAEAKKLEEEESAFREKVLRVLDIASLQRVFKTFPTIGGTMPLALTKTGQVISWASQEAGGGIDLSLFPFAPTVDGATVTIAEGEVRRGIRSAVLVSHPGITLTADAYIYVNVVRATMVCSIDQSATQPTSDATNYKRWLYYYTVSDGAATLNKIGSLGNIELSGVTA